MKIIKDHTEKKWFIAHSNGDHHHFGEVEVGTVLETGQAVLEVFDTEDAMASALNSYKNDADYYAKYLKSLDED